MIQTEVRTVVALSVMLSALTPVAGLCQFTGDRGRSVQQLPMVMESLIPDILSRGIQSESRPLLRRAFADTVIIDGIAIEREYAIDRVLEALARERQPGHKIILSIVPEGHVGSERQLLLFSVGDSAPLSHQSAKGSVSPKLGQLSSSANHKPGSYKFSGDAALPPSAETQIMPASAPSVTQMGVVTLEGRARDRVSRVTRISFGNAAEGR